jgi:hypothetical protein
MYYQPGGLIDHDEVRVVIYDLEWDLFGNQSSGLRLRKCDFDRLASRDLEAGFAGTTVYEDIPCFDELLDE